MMDAPEFDDESNIKKLMTYSVDDLIAFREVQKRRVESKSSAHWLTRLEKKCDRSFYPWIRNIGVFLLLSGFLILVIPTLVFFGNPEKITTVLKFVIPGVTTFVVGAIMLKSLLDGTHPLRRELRNIELVLEEKTSNPEKSIMIDTNIPDDHLSGKITREEIEKAKEKGYRFYTTHVQFDQMYACPDEEKRKKLLLFMGTLQAKTIDTESHVLGISRLGFSKIQRSELLEELIAGSTDSRKITDALIAETALKRKYTLLTNDKNLRMKIFAKQGRAMTTEEFKTKITQ